MDPIRRSGREGFTLVEIMVVVGILTLVLAMGAPSFVRTLKQEPLRKATRDLQDGLAHARAQAILRGATTEFILNSTDGSMSVRLAPEAVGITPGTSAEFASSAETPFEAKTGTQAGASMPPFSARLHPDIAVVQVELNLRSQMEVEEVRVRFHSNGTSDDFLIVIDWRAGKRVVFLDPITGLADMRVIR